MDITNMDLEEIDMIRINYMKPDIILILSQDNTFSIGRRPSVNSNLEFDVLCYINITDGVPCMTLLRPRMFIIKQGNRFSEKQVGSTCPESFNRALNIDVGKLTGYYGKTTLNYESENTLGNNSD